MSRGYWAHPKSHIIRVVFQDQAMYERSSFRGAKTCKNGKKRGEKVYFRSQILELPSIGEYWNISGTPVLPKNVIYMFFRTCWCYSEAYNTGTQKWSSIGQYSCTRIWDLKYTFSKCVFRVYFHT